VAEVKVVVAIVILEDVAHLEEDGVALIRNPSNCKHAREIIISMRSAGTSLVIRNRHN